MKRSIAVVTFCALLAGCQQAGNRSVAKAEQAQATETSSMLSTRPAVNVGNDAALYTCMKELNALQQVSPAAYQSKNAELNQILTQAKLYTQVRANLSREINGILDSGYQYRIGKACNDIRTALTQALVERVENI
ncbi:hypothetical protein KH388_05570 [Serratia rubidaea]|nr:hypothetical protein [Serratia rubidaea]